MRVVTKRELIKGVRNSWREQYQREICDLTNPRHHDRAAVDDALFRLDTDTCSEADVDAVIGVKGWVRNECDECHRDMDTLVRIGPEPDFDVRYLDLCADCISAASKLT